MSDPIINELLNRFRLRLPKKTIDKCLLYYQQILSTNRKNLFKDQTRIPVLCLDIACAMNKASFPTDEALQTLGIKGFEYLKDRNTLLTSLSLPVPIKTFKELSVLFGCIYIVPFCEELSCIFEEKYSIQNPNLVLDVSNQDVIFAIFFRLLQKAKSNPSKKEKEQLGVGTTNYVQYTKKLNELCGDYIHDLKINKEQRMLTEQDTKNVLDCNTKGSKVSKKDKKYVTGINLMVQPPFRNTLKYNQFLSWKTAYLDKLEKIIG